MNEKEKINIKLIVDNDLCISCGACIHICPFDNIIMSYIKSRGKYDALIKNENQCLECNGLKNCLAVCPSYNVNYDELANSKDNDFLGRIEKVYNGYSKDYNIRFSSSSGGFIRALVKELLDKSLIDGVISLVHDKGLEYFPKIITDTFKMPNSIYHNINYEDAIELLKNNKGKYLIIGLPCQITSIELLLKKKFKFLKERIYAKVALICGYTFDRTNVEFFAKVNKFDIDQISYREQGRYKKTRISNKKRSKLFDIYNPSNIIEKINNNIMFDKWMPQKQCLFCVDHLGYCADIVVGDAWQEKYKNDKIGTNIIIVRTKKGHEIVKNLNTVILEEGSLSDIESSQGIYAKPFLGLTFAKENIFNDLFVPNHIVSNDFFEFKPIILTLKDKLKIIFLKKLMRKRYFRLVQLFYIIIEWKYFFKLLIKKIIGRKI